MEIIKKYYHFITPAIVFVIYLITLAPTVIQIDAGELAAVQCTLGIAHPTGYPLFTLTGFLFSLIPLPFSKIYQLNLLAALWCTAGVFIFMITAKLLLNNLSPAVSKKTSAASKSNKAQHGNKDKKKNIVKDEFVNKSEFPELLKIISITAGAFILALSETFWFQSTSVEVYSLHIFLILLITFFLLKAYLRKDDNLKPWLLFAAILALGFSNHMTTMLILPGTAYLYFNKYGFNKKAFRRIGFMLLIFFPVLILLYSYLPMRAANNPTMNWGNPVDWERLLRHISGKQYQVWLFSSTAAAKKQFIYFFNSLTSEYSINIFFCMFGMIAAYMMSKKIFVFLLITFAFTVLYSINYDIADIDSYFLLAYISLSFFAVYALLKLLSVFTLRGSRNQHIYSISAVVVSFFIVLQLYFNFGKVNQGNTYTFEEYTKSLLNSTDKNSFIFSYQWDYFVSASYYFQNVEGFRKDVTIADKELLRRSWYFNQLENAHPDLLAGVQTEKNSFLYAVKPFEEGKNYNENLIENAYRRLMTNLVSTNSAKHQVYIGPELFENEMQNGQFKLPQGYTLVPDLLLFRVVKGNSYVPAADPNFKITFTGARNHYSDFIERNLAGPMLVRRAMYEMQFDKRDRAKLYIEKAKKDFPGYIIPEGIEAAIEK